MNVNRKEGKGKEEKAEEAAVETLQKAEKVAKAKAVERAKETKEYVSTSTMEMAIADLGQTAISVTTSRLLHFWDQQAMEEVLSQIKGRRKGRKCTLQPWWLS